MGLAEAITVTPSTDLTGWIPIRVSRRASGPVVSWCWSGDARFDPPFWTHTANRLMSDPFRLLFQHTSGLTELQRHAGRHHAVPPAGFVYHMSRCGSTLVASALATIPDVTVLSEPAPLDQMLRALVGHPVDEQVLAARSMLKCLSPVPDGPAERLIVKLDSWHIHLFPIIRQAFPTVPWIFLARNPLEVMASHEIQRGAQMVPGAIPSEILHIPDEPTSLDEHGARVLAELLKSALRHVGDGGLLVDYAELPGALPARIQPHFALASTPPDHAIFATHAKNPVLGFSPDGAHKRGNARAALRETTERIVGEPYAAFDSARVSQLAACGPT